ncbi:MAG: F0F1 ATP synthase subunit delta [Gammaproteobacteria bacterium]|nr:F0F1 ATP synthase subunit delta [Gammaproteobacteria bacterium]MDX2461014.1 F0F1 ATP synthase subunit delta [Gammaproteobacteria bacterium]
MELSWSTFLLEIINFLVLAWILKRFLYRPVLDVIARRRAGIEKTLSDAEARHDEAQVLREQYEQRLTRWEDERRQGRAELQHEIEEERARRMKELQDLLVTERKKAQVIEQRELAEALRRNEATALAHGARFASRLLGYASGPELEARLLELLLDEIGTLSTERLEALRRGIGEPASDVVIATAFPLADVQRARLTEALTTALAMEVSPRYEADSELLAGLSVSIGSWTLGANLRDELKGFAEFSDASR